MPKHDPAPLELVAWNCYVANSDDNVERFLDAVIRRYRPHVIALSEARTHYSTIAAVAVAHGYAHHQELPKRARNGVVDDTGDSALLVRALPDRRTRLGRTRPAIVRRRVVAMRRPWVVASKNRTHTPRRYESVVLWVDGHRWRVRADHWPTLGFEGRNRAAFLESARNARRWLLATGPRTSSVIVGDLNEQRRTLATWLGRRFRVYGKGIDVALTCNVEHGDWAELGTGGGDHHARHYRLTPPRRGRTLAEHRAEVAP